MSTKEDRYKVILKDVTPQKIADARKEICKWRLTVQSVIVPSKEYFDELLADPVISAWFSPSTRRKETDIGCLGELLGAKVYVRPVEHFELRSVEPDIPCFEFRYS